MNALPRIRYIAVILKGVARIGLIVLRPDGKSNDDTTPVDPVVQVNDESVTGFDNSNE